MKKIKLAVIAVFSALALSAAPAHTMGFDTWIDWWGDKTNSWWGDNGDLKMTSPDGQVDVEKKERPRFRLKPKPEMVYYCYRTGAPYQKSKKHPRGKPVEKGSAAEEELKNSPHNLIPCSALPIDDAPEE